MKIDKETFFLFPITGRAAPAVETPIDEERAKFKCKEMIKLKLYFF